MKSLSINVRSRNFLKERAVHEGETLISEIISISSPISKCKVAWPFVACIPQSGIISEQDVNRVIVKLSTNFENTIWETERPVVVNKEYSKDQVAEVSVSSSIFIQIYIKRERWLKIYQINGLCLKIIKTSHYSMKMKRFSKESGGRVNNFLLPM